MKPSSKVIAKKAAPRKAASSAISRITVAEGPNERSVSIRKIENGYIVSESNYGPKGYKCTERFTDKAPKIDMGVTKAKK